MVGAVVAPQADWVVEAVAVGRDAADEKAARAANAFSRDVTTTAPMAIFRHSCC